jgi:hypothetical protein
MDNLHKTREGPMVLKCAVLLLLNCVPVFAGEFVPYVALRGLFASAGVLPDAEPAGPGRAVSALDDTYAVGSQVLQQHRGFGGILEFGLARGPVSVYLGYRYSQVRRSAHASYKPLGMPGGMNERSESRWNDNRFALGARWELWSRNRFPVRPSVGAGVTMGWICQSIIQKDYSSRFPDVVESYRASAVSKAKYGCEAELLAAITLTQKLDLIVAGQFEAIRARFQPYRETYVGEHTDWLNEESAQLGLRYNF